MTMGGEIKTRQQLLDEQADAATTRATGDQRRTTMSTATDQRQR
jgi:hypothetical protein